MLKVDVLLTSSRINFNHDCIRPWKFYGADLLIFWTFSKTLQPNDKMICLAIILETLRVKCFHKRSGFRSGQNQNLSGTEKIN